MLLHNAISLLLHQIRFKYSLSIIPLKPRGNYMNHLLYHSVKLHFVFVAFV
jgi:hypothetical protein